MTVSAKSSGTIATLALAIATLALPLAAQADPDSHDPRGARGSGPAQAQAPAQAPRPAFGGGEIPGPHNQPAPMRPAPAAQPAPAAPNGWNGGNRPNTPQAQPQPQPQAAQNGWNTNRPNAQRPDAAHGPEGWRGNEPPRGNEGWRGTPSWNGQPGWNQDHRGPEQARPRVEYRAPAYRGGDNREWSHDWRRDNRYDWQGWRRDNRMAFHVGRYYPPYSGYAYRRLSVGIFLQPLFFGDTYRIYDPWSYHLPAAYGPYQWVRYYDDAVLVNIYTGAVTDVLYDFFW